MIQLATLATLAYYKLPALAMLLQGEGEVGWDPISLWKQMGWLARIVVIGWRSPGSGCTDPERAPARAGDDEPRRGVVAPRPGRHARRRPPRSEQRPRNTESRPGWRRLAHGCGPDAATRQRETARCPGLSRAVGWRPCPGAMPSSTTLRTVKSDPPGW